MRIMHESMTQIILCDDGSRRMRKPLQPQTAARHPELAALWYDPYMKDDGEAGFRLIESFNEQRDLEAHYQDMLKEDTK